jgi:hypothetical protein
MDARRKMEFRRCLNRLSNQLSRQNLEDMKFVCKDHVPVARMERVRSSLDIFQALEERGKLSSTDTAFLVKVLVSIERSNLVSELISAGFAHQDALQRNQASAAPAPPLQGGIRTQQHPGPPVQSRELLFNEMLLKIAQNLSARDIEALTFTLCDSLLGMNADRVSSATQLFQLLQQRQIVTPTNLQALYNELENINRRDLSEKINKYLAEIGQPLCQPAMDEGEKRERFAYVGSGVAAFSSSQDGDPVKDAAPTPTAPPFEPQPTPNYHQKNWTASNQGYQVTESVQARDDAGSAIMLTGLGVTASAPSYTPYPTTHPARCHPCPGQPLPQPMQTFLQPVQPHTPPIQPYPPPLQPLPATVQPILPPNPIAGPMTGLLDFAKPKYKQEGGVGDLGETRAREMNHVDPTVGPTEKKPVGKTPVYNTAESLPLEPPTHQIEWGKLIEVVQSVVKSDVKIGRREVKTELSEGLSEMKTELRELQEYLKGAKYMSEPFARFGQFYPMLPSSRHGKAIIIVNETFVNRDPRPGAKADKSLLEKTFEDLGYVVELHENLSAARMLSAVRQAAEKSHGAHDSFVCCISTHGSIRVLQGTDGEVVSRSELVQIVKQSETLRGKPKIFFIEACREIGLHTDKEGKPIYDNSWVNYTRSLETSEQEADVFVANATTTYCKAHCDADDGSWFAKAINSVFTDPAFKDFTLTTLMHEVNRMVCGFKGSYREKGIKSGDPNITRKCYQCIEITSTFRKSFNFKFTSQ